MDEIADSSKQAPPRPTRADDPTARHLAQHFRLAVDAAEIGVWEFDLENRVLAWDERMMELYGYTPETFTGVIDAWTKGLHPEDKERAEAELWASLANRLPFDTRFRVILPSGEVRLIDAHGLVYENDEGVPVKMIGINRDVSDEEQFEREMQRTAALESLGLLAGGIAHDFNNLLSSMASNIAFLQARNPGTDDDDASYRDLRQAIELSQALTAQLMVFADGGAPVKSAIPFRPLVEEALSFALRGSSVRLDFGGIDEATTGIVHADRSQLGQAFHNLAINARQAMNDSGCVAVNIERRVLERARGPLDAGAYIVTTIADDGPGIPEKDIANIFTPYFSTRREGRGLGLAICHSVVQRHQGHITVESRQGRGTTFTVWIPASNEAPAARRVSSVAPARQNGRVLIIDDDPLVRRGVSRALRNAGFDVQAVATRRAAIGAFDGDAAFDVVVVDLTLPGELSGDRIAAELRAIDPTPYYIVSSGYSDSPVMSDFASYGFDACMPKPADIDKLTRLINRGIEIAAKRRA